MLCHNLVAFQCEQPMSKVGVLYTFSQKLVIRHRSVDSWCRGTMLKRVKEFDLNKHRTLPPSLVMMMSSHHYYVEVRWRRSAIVFWHLQTILRKKKFCWMTLWLLYNIQYKRDTPLQWSATAGTVQGSEVCVLIISKPQYEDFYFL